MRRQPRRRRLPGEHENHDRWLVSYADFITLLFAFFVIMYALSSVSDGNYRILSDAIQTAFHNQPQAPNTLQTIQTPQPPLTLPMIVPKPPLINRSEQENQRLQVKQQVQEMATDISDVLAPLIKTDQVKVKAGPQGLTVEINANALFQPGEARLASAAIPPLTAVAHILAKTSFPITVEGHTDNQPINTPLFASNWELSGVRAASVVRLMIDNGVKADLLKAAGYADQRPVADNATAEGRARNRRVAITIDAKQAAELTVPTGISDKTGEPAR